MAASIIGCFVLVMIHREVEGGWDSNAQIYNPCSTCVTPGNLTLGFSQLQYYHSSQIEINANTDPLTGTPTPYVHAGGACGQNPLNGPPVVNYQSSDIIITRGVQNIPVIQNYYLAKSQPNNGSCPLFDKCSFGTTSCPSVNCIGSVGSLSNTFCNQQTKLSCDYMTLNQASLYSRLVGVNPYSSFMAVMCPTLNSQENFKCGFQAKVNPFAVTPSSLYLDGSQGGCNGQLKAKYNCSSNLQYTYDMKDSLGVYCVANKCNPSIYWMERWQKVDWSAAFSGGLKFNEPKRGVLGYKSTHLLPLNAVKLLAKGIVDKDPFYKGLGYIAMTTWSMNPQYGIIGKYCPSELKKCFTGQGSEAWFIFIQLTYAKLFVASVPQHEVEPQWLIAIKFLEELLKLHRPASNKCYHSLDSSGQPSIDDDVVNIWSDCWAEDIIAHGNSSLDFPQLLNTARRDEYLFYDRNLEMVTANNVVNEVVYTAYIAWNVARAFTSSSLTSEDFLFFHRIFHSVCHFTAQNMARNQAYVSVCNVFGGHLDDVGTNAGDKGEIQLSIGSKPTSYTEGFKTTTKYFSYGYQMNDPQDYNGAFWQNVVAKNLSFSCLVKDVTKINNYACLYTPKISGVCYHLISLLNVKGGTIFNTKYPLNNSVSIFNKYYSFISIDQLGDKNFNLTSYCGAIVNNSELSLPEVKYMANKPLKLECQAYISTINNNLIYPIDFKNCPVVFPTPAIYFNDGKWFIVSRLTEQFSCVPMPYTNTTSQPFLANTTVLPSRREVTVQLEVDMYNILFNSSDVLIQYESGIVMRASQPALVTDDINSVVVKITMPDICEMSMPDSLIDCATFVCGSASDCQSEVVQYCTGKDKLVAVSYYYISQLKNRLEAFRNTITSLDDGAVVTVATGGRSRRSVTTASEMAFSLQSMQALRTQSLPTRLPRLETVEGIQLRTSNPKSPIEFTKTPSDLIRGGGKMGIIMSGFTKVLSVGMNVLSFVNGIILDVLISRLDQRMNIMENQIMRVGDTLIQTTNMLYNGLQSVAAGLDDLNNRFNQMADFLKAELSSMRSYLTIAFSQIDRQVFYLNAVSRFMQVHTTAAFELTNNIKTVDQAHDNLVKCMVSLNKGFLDPTCIPASELTKILNNLTLPNNCSLALSSNRVLDYYSLAFHGVSAMRGQDLYVALDIPLFCQNNHAVIGRVLENLNLPKKMGNDYFILADFHRYYLKADNFITPVDINQCVINNGIAICPTSALMEPDCVTQIIVTGNGTCKMVKVESVNECYHIGSNLKYCLKPQPAFVEDSGFNVIHVISGVSVIEGMNAIYSIQHASPPNMISTATLTPLNVTILDNLKSNVSYVDLIADIGMSLNQTLTNFSNYMQETNQQINDLSLENLNIFSILGGLTHNFSNYLIYVVVALCSLIGLSVLFCCISPFLNCVKLFNCLKCHLPDVKKQSTPKKYFY
nr:ORF95 [Acipenserid herpesvirus 1]